jgi:hypothetical protein
MNNSRLFTFVAGGVGSWAMTKMRAVKGDPLAMADRLDVVNGPLAEQAGGTFAVDESPQRESGEVVSADDSE